MGTHYETLGVAPSASSREIRKAYLRRARALHPDRQLGRPAEDARRAEEAMQVVNVAWNVLSDPKKKAVYDQRIGSGPRQNPQRKQQPTDQRPPSAQQRTASSSGPRQQAPRASSTANAASSANRSTTSKNASSGSIWASIPVLVVLGVVLGVIVVAVFVNNGDGDNRPVIQADTELIPGDCFRLVGNTPREIECSTGNADGQVTEVGPEPGNCPDSGQLPLRDPQSDFYLCWARMVPGSANTIP